ncbi:MAG: hypothetical protein JO069_10640 [Verrucomicrobia bacterium]|nr:hypothetical protein [Verrucomicrobiota bacterium]
MRSTKQLHLDHYWWRLQVDQKRGFTGTWNRFVTLKKAAELRLPPPRNDETTRVHILTSARDWRCCAWMLVSFFHASGKAWAVTFHDDGTCDRTTQGEIMAVAPFAQFLSRSEADARMEKRLEAFPRTLALRRQAPLMLRLLDASMLSDEPNQLVLSSDLMFFLTPRELLWWEQDRSPASLFLRDFENCYSLSPTEIAGQLGFEPVRRLNSGIAALRNGFVSLPLIEEALSKIPRLSTEGRWNIEQTLFAILAAAKPSDLLPPSYVVSPDEGKPPWAVMRHYVGQVHDQYYSEGLEKMASILLSQFSRGRPRRPYRPIWLPVG